MKRYEGTMRAGALSPLRALTLAGLASAGAQVSVLAAVGVTGMPLVLYFMSQMTPWTLFDAFVPALCLVPLAARLKPTLAVALYAAAAFAWPVASVWARHPYEAGIWPGFEKLDWLGGIPLFAYGGMLGILAVREPSGGTAPPAGHCYASVLSASVALVVCFLLSSLLFRGGTFDMGAVAASAALYVGALGGVALKGPAAGLALHVLTRGLPTATRVPVFCLLAFVVGPLPLLSAKGTVTTECALWIAGVVLYVLAAASPNAPRRSSRGAVATA